MEAQGFKLSSLLKPFELKSSVNKNRCAFYYIVKSLLHSTNKQWADLPNQLIDDNLVNEIKNLLPLKQVLEMLKEKETEKANLIGLLRDGSLDSQFKQNSIERFEKFYNSEIKKGLIEHAGILARTISDFTKFLSCPEEEIGSMLEILVKVNAKHQSFA